MVDFILYNFYFWWFSSGNVNKFCKVTLVLLTQLLRFSIQRLDHTLFLLVLTRLFEFGRPQQGKLLKVFIL